ncbi:MAG: IPT/TIG domain-containing protein [Pyrinomonadaceae bacterium]
MTIFEGKTQTEKNKLIAAAVLGVVALAALYMAFGRNLFGSTATSVTVKTSLTPKPGATPGAVRNEAVLPTVDEQNFVYQTTPVVYQPGNSFAPDPGRNIFAFYEPPPPTPYVPTPIPVVIVKPPSPTPTPIFLATLINPQTAFAGSRSFRLEVGGERFTPDARIYFNQTEMPTTFVNPQKVVADIPANMIAQEGPRQIIVQTPDGRAYSTQLMFTVQAPPRPGFEYIGMIGRKRYNNDTAYLLENGKTQPFGARLNDIVSGRFRLVDISPTEVVFDDISLGFRHKIAISQGPSGSGGPPLRGQPDGGFVPYNPNNIPQGDIPGFPGQRFVTPSQIQPQNPPQKKKPVENKNDDVDDDGDGD